MTSLPSLIGALSPVFLLIVLGFLLRRTIFRKAEFWHPIENLAYYVLFPALFLSTLSKTPFAVEELAPLLLVIAGAIVMISCLLLSVRGIFLKNGPSFSSVFQGAIRYNTYVGMSAAGALYGQAGVALLAVIAAFMVPLVNVLSVYVLTRHASRRPFSRGIIVKEILGNPLIISSFCGLALGFLRMPFPAVVEQGLDALGKASLPLGLLAVGAGLELGAIPANRSAMFLGSGLKLCLFPVLVWAGLRIAGIQPHTAAVAILYAALPTASSAFILARALGGDYRLMAGLISFQTLLAFATMPLMLLFLQV
ncbi:MAG TPA: AEC family transporter [Dissulfurispiraceae bacterium]|nr:AEC family transporter [Dissulfurispiraceae bacterium]